jgi:glutamate racemase
MAEEKLRGKSLDLGELSQLLLPILNKVDVAVLGCTHFPLIREEIQIVMGMNVQLIDSGEAIARRVESLLGTQEIKEGKGTRDIFATAPPWEEGALNRTLELLGFNPVQHRPLVI